ncbi:HAD-IIA family hydrolase [Pseudobacteriovorax antillogorgiicola]|uniref:HAD-superfamily class IIA hydrolase, TIGR01459 n=1 Tax=Pseudobacteriovorax antillogorgiicola TaxID=1513793 RepID=A0A1Y6BU52_9BACT|nr:HAD hydrolase-like protein [Pseudobacteriovorax antillogorgiicola]TCS53855.1 HAD superfamily hydrolase (TIGR01459 family) [Pseudobacteriovorax antillogorgiicola]SMF21502.1 HAD-superfamily class IIA hydrolase, TIGR01459 [Pseudobacteriovorax antillogorgiicola]
MQELKSIYEITKNFDGFLFDAYGVLVDEQGLLEGATELLSHLESIGKPFWMLTNGSSKTVADTVKRYRNMGLPFSVDNVITSGALLSDCLDQLTEPGQAIGVLGTEGSHQLVRDAGRCPVAITESKDFDILVIANQTDYDFVPALDAALSLAIDRIDRGLNFTVVLTNPDLFYPKGENRFGITAGSVSLILEECLKLRYGSLPPNRIIKLGKPFPPMFREAERRAGSKRLVMVGDQIYTDIKGANDYGFQSVLVATGLTGREMLDSLDDSLKPSYFVNHLKES